MSLALRPASAGRFAYDVAFRAEGGDWSALVIPEEVSCVEVASDVVEQLELFTKKPVKRLDDPTLAQLWGSLIDGEGAILVLVVGNWSENRWKKLDFFRSRLAHAQSLVFILSAPSFEKLVRTAPNLASFLDATTSLHDPSDSAASEYSQRWRNLEPEGG